MNIKIFKFRNLDIIMDNNRGIQNTEEEKVLSIIKSCVESTDQCLTLDELNRDYIQLVGSPIPFRSFQHGSLASFLQSFPKTIKVFNSGGKLFVKKVSCEQTSHIEKFIRQQKKSNSRGAFSNVKVLRKPLTTSWRPPPSYSAHPQNSSTYKPFLPTPSVRPQHKFRQFTYSNYPHKKTPSYSARGNVYIPECAVPEEKVPSKGLIVNQPAKKPYGYSKLVPQKELGMPVPATKMSLREELEKEAKRRGITRIEFCTFVCGKKDINYISTLTLGDQIFRSYPDERPTAFEAEELVSKMALETLKTTIKPFSHPQTKDFDLAAERIRKLLQNESNILWWDHIKNLYSKEFNETIDPSWVQTAFEKGVEGITIDHPATKSWILSLMKDDPSSSMVNGVVSPTPNPPSPQKSIPPKLPPKLPPLKLPEDKMWSVYICYFKNCSEVWFRLIGDEYSEQLEELVTNMELHYMTMERCSTAKNLEIDGYYTLSHEGSFFRVRLVSVQGETATVFFIDHGDSDEVSTSQLYTLDPKFLELPAQGINACLAGFEYGFNDPVILAEVQNLIFGKPMIVDVFSRQDTISVVLYDTSTQEDVNINQLLLQKLTESYPEPQFPSKGGMAEVYVSHVTPEGDIFVVIESATYKALQSLLATAKERAAEILGDDSLSIDIGKLYLAKFSNDGEWQRAGPRTSNRDANGKVLLRALDSGFCGRVASANILLLEKVSPALCRIPPQSLVCRLHGVPSAPGMLWTQKTSERLVSILPSRSKPMLMKVIKEEEEDKRTQVELFHRLPPQDLLVSINATLDMDHSLFRNEDKNNNLKNGETLKSKSQAASSAEKQPTFDRKDLALQELGLPPLPEIGSYFDVFVTYAASPSHFAVQSWSSTMRLEWLMGEMKAFYSDEVNRKPVEKICPGGVYALFHDDNSWYRVQVEQVHDQLVSGAFVDYGDCFCSSTDKIQPLWANFKQLSRQAFKAKLGGIAPLNIDWRPEDSCRFRELVENREFVSVVKDIVETEGQKTPTLILCLIDTKDPVVDVNIGDLLVTEDRAKKC